jgi:hypothetical protein
LASHCLLNSAWARFQLPSPSPASPSPSPFSF